MRGKPALLCLAVLVRVNAGNPLSCSSSGGGRSSSGSHSGSRCCQCNIGTPVSRRSSKESTFSPAARAAWDLRGGWLCAASCPTHAGAAAGVAPGAAAGTGAARLGHARNYHLLPRLSPCSASSLPASSITSTCTLESSIIARSGAREPELGSDHHPVVAAAAAALDRLRSRRRRSRGNRSSRRSVRGSSSSNLVGCYGQQKQQQQQQQQRQMTFSRGRGARSTRRRKAAWHGSSGSEQTQGRRIGGRRFASAVARAAAGGGGAGRARHRRGGAEAGTMVADGATQRRTTWGSTIGRRRRRRRSGGSTEMEGGRGYEEEQEETKAGRGVTLAAAAAVSISPSSAEALDALLDTAVERAKAFAGRAGQALHPAQERAAATSTAIAGWFSRLVPSLSPKQPIAALGERSSHLLELPSSLGAGGWQRVRHWAEGGWQGAVTYLHTLHTPSTSELGQQWNALVEAVVDRLQFALLNITIPTISWARKEPLQAAFLMALLVNIVWISLLDVVQRVLKRYFGRGQARGLYVKRRPKHSCYYCGGFGIVECDLCLGTGYRLDLESRIIYSEPCAKCIARRWQYCERCGGSGSRLRAWGTWSVQRFVHSLLSG